MTKALHLGKSLLLISILLCLSNATRADVFGLININQNALRNAINNANSNGTGLDTIVFYSNGTITLDSALPTITGALLIQGAGASQTTIQADSNSSSSGYRVFNLTGTSTVTFRDLTIKNGYITAGDGAGVKAVNNTLYFYDCMFEDNKAAGSSNTGGAIDTQGDLFVTRCSFIGNTHSRNGGAVGWHPPTSNKTAEFTNVTFSQNSCGASQVNHGGGAFSAYSFGATHTLKFINCTFNENSITGTSPGNGKSFFIAAINSTFNVTLLNTVFADAASGNYNNYLQGSGSISTTRSYTVSSDASISAVGTGNTNSASSIGIDTLDYHGSTMLLYSIAENSMLVDNGTSTGAPGEDQRQVPKSGNKDIGSFEYFEQACDTPSLPTTYTRNMASRQYTITNMNIAGQGNVAFVNPGQSINVTFNYSIAQNGSYCPGCIVQFYWGISGYYGHCERNFGGYCNCSGAGNRTFNAPSTPGIYYFTTGQGLGFSCSASPQNRVTASSTVAFGAIIVGTPVNGSLVSIVGQTETCFAGGDSLKANTVVGYTCTGLNLNTFQWFKDSVAIASSNVESLPISDEGMYYVRWYNKINESVYSDTFEVNSILRDFDSPSPIGLYISKDTLTGLSDSAIVMLTSSQIGADYVLIDTLSGLALTDTLSGNGDTLRFAFLAKDAVNYAFWGTRQGCAKNLDTTFSFEFSDPRPYAGLGNTVRLDGINDELRIPSDPDFYFSGGEMTISFWLKRNDLATNRVVLGRWTGAPYHFVFGFKFDGAPDGQFRFRTSTGYQNVLFSSGNVTGTWEHWTITAKQAQNIKIYKDGQLITTQAITGIFNLTGSSHIALGGMGNGIKWFNGSMDEVSFWKKELDLDEVRRTMALEIDTSDANLVAYYPLNHGAGTDTARDISGNEHDAYQFLMNTNSAWGPGADTFAYVLSEGLAVNDTLIHLPGYDEGGDSLIFEILSGNENSTFSLAEEGALVLDDKSYFDFEYDPSISLTYRVSDQIFYDTATIVLNLENENDEPIAGFDKALDFDGVDDYMDLTGNTAVDLTDSLTFEAWVNPRVSSGRIFHNGGNNLLPGWTIFFKGSNLRVEFRNGSVAQADVNYSSYLNEWHHLAVSWNQAEKVIRVFIDGDLVRSRNFNPTIGIFIGEPGLGGQSDGGNLYNGLMDEVRIWDAWRSQAQIQADMRKTVDPNDPKLAAYFNFDLVDLGTDVSPNRNHGQANGFSAGSSILAVDSIPWTYTESSDPVGSTIAWASGFDWDANDILSFDLLNYTNVFDLDSSTGELNNKELLDFELDSVYHVNFTVTDSSSELDTGLIIIELENEQEQVIAGFGEGFDFNGSGFIALPDTARYFNAITIETWIKPRAMSNINTIVACKASGGAAGWGFYSNTLLSGDRKLILESSNGSISTANPVIQIGEWQHVAFTISGGTAVKLFHNGVEVASGNLSAQLSNSGLRQIGAFNDNSYNARATFDEFRIWNVARTPVEIATNYRSRIDTSTANLRAYYDFNQFDTDFTLRDRSSNGFDGNLTFLSGNEWTSQGGDTLEYQIPESVEFGDSIDFALAYDPDDSPLTFIAIGGDSSLFDLIDSTGLLLVGANANFDYESGDTIFYLTYEVEEAGDLTKDSATMKIRITDANDAPILSYGNAIEFDGVNDYASLGTGINVANKSFTISFLGKLDQPNNGSLRQVFLGQGSVATLNGLHLLTEFADRVKFGFYNDDLIPFTSFNAEWHHYAFTFDSGSKERRIYIDGDILGVDTASGNYTGTGELRLGRETWGAGNYLDGTMDELKIFDTLFNINQVRRDQGRRLVGDEPNLVSYHSFNRGSGTSLVDVTGNHNGTFINDADPYIARDTLIYFLSENRPDFDTIGSLPAVDPDSDTLTFYALSGDTSNVSILLDGSIVVNGIDYELDSILDIVARVEDDFGLSDTADVRIKIKNVNETPFFNSSLDTLIACAGVSSNSSNITVIDLDIEDSLQALNVFGISADTSLLSDSNFVFSILDDSTLSVSVISEVITSPDTVSFDLIVVDGEGASDTTSQVLVIYPSLTLALDTIASPLCFGDTNAYISLNIADGTAPYTYLWDNGSTNDSLLNVGSGSFSVTVTDNLACLDSASFVVNDPTQVVASISSSVNPSCFEYSDGFAVGSALGGLAPYSFSWNDSLAQSTDTASNLPDGTYELVVTDSFACTDTTQIVLVEPSQVPASFVFSVDTICEGDQSTLTANAGPSYTYRWKRNAAFVAGLNAQVVQVSDAGVYSVEVTDSNSCFNLSSNDTLTKNQLPNAFIGSLQDQCDQLGDSLTLIAGSPSGGTYSSTTAGAVVSNVFIPSIAGVGQHTIIYHYTSLSGCSSSDSATITVNTKPAASLSLGSSFCIGDTALELVGGLPSAGSGVYAGNGVNAGFFNPNIAGAGAHNIAYQYTDTNACSDTAFALVSVNRKPVLSHSNLNAQCVDASPLVLSGGSATPLGGSSSYSGDAVFAGSFYPDSAGVGQHFITYSYTDLNGCTDSLARNITVNALPAVSMTSADYCAIPGSNVTLNQGFPAGGVYTGSGITGTDVFNPGTVGTGNYSITYTYTNTKGCSNDTAANILVNALPVVSFSSAFSAVCESVDTVNVGLGSPQTGGTGQYSGFGLIGEEIITSLSGTGSISVTYIFTDTNSCVDSVSQAITINPLPNVSLAGQSPVCADASPVALIGGLPSGGSYSGAGVSASSFAPSVSLVGSNTITYTYTDVQGCTDSATSNLTVFALPNVSLNLSLNSYCENDTVLSLTGGQPQGGTYSGTGVSAGNFDPQLSGSGTQVISYSFTDFNACSASASDSIDVSASPSISLSSYGEVCADALAFNLTNGVGVGSGTSLYSGPGVSNNQFDPASAGIGTHNINFQFTDSANSCLSDTTASIIVRGLPNIGLNLPNALCLNNGPELLVGGSPAGGTYSGTGVFGDTLLPLFAGLGVDTISYSFTDTFNCSNSATALVDILALPKVSASSNDEFCANEDPLGLRPDSIYQAGRYFYVGGGIFNDSIFDPAVANLGVNTILYIFIDTNSCRRDTFINITVNPTPTVSFSNLSPVCENANSFILNQGSSIGTGGTAWYEGPGILSDSTSFNADTANAGIHTIKFFYRDRNNCIDSSSQTIQVDTVPRPVFTSVIPDFCANTSPYPLSEGSPVPTNAGESSSYSGIGVLNGIFYPQYVNPSNTYMLSYQFQDANGCSGEISQTIEVNSLPVLTSSFIPTRCDNEGIDTLSFVSIQSAGIANSYFTGVGIDSNDSLSFDPSVSGQGNHLISFHLTDTNSCSSTAQSYVTVYGSSQAFLASFTSICEGASSITLSGGVPLGGSYFGNGVSNGQFNPAVADTGNHNIKYVYTNIFGCTDSALSSIHVNPSPSLSLNLPSAFCERQTPYDLQGGSPQGGTYAGLGVFNDKFYTTITSQGSFNISYSLSDTNNCSAIISKQVQVVGNPNVSLTPDTLICNNDRVRLRASGGTVYQWNTGSTSSSILVRPSQNETYKVSVTDANGCLGTEEVKVFVSPEIVLSSSTTESDCGLSNGVGSVQASGGVSPFGFVWSNGSIGDVQTNLRAGLYQVSATDANRCQSVITVAVSDVGGASIVSNSISNPSCFGEDDGYISVNVTGANSPINLEWNTGASTNALSGLQAGTYLLSMKDSENCLSFASYELEDPEQIEVELVTQDATCQSNDGYVKALVMAPGPIQYNWSTGSSNDSIGGLSAGVYELNIIDANSCSDSVQVIISDLGGPQVVYDSIINTKCGTNQGLISLNVLDSSLMYTWSTGDTSALIDSLAPGAYFVTVEDTAQCQTIMKTEISSFIPEPTELCMVSVDTATGQVKLYFSFDTTQSVSQYKAYREDVSGLNQFFVGSTTSSGEIVGTNLTTISGPQRYSIAIEDSCSNISDLSAAHRIIYVTAIPLPTGPIKVSWTAYEGFEPLRYNIYRSADGGPWTVVNVVGAFQQTYFDGNYPKETTNLRYLIAAEAPELCEGKRLSFSNTSNNAWDLISTGLASNPSDIGIIVFPNPSKGIFNLRYTGLNDKLSLRVTNSAGQLVYVREFEALEGDAIEPIDLRGMSVGVYHLQIQTGHQVSVTKLQLLK